MPVLLPGETLRALFELQIRLILEAVVRGIPGRGLDPVKVLGWLFTAKVPSVVTNFQERPSFEQVWYPGEEELPWLCGLAGSAILHRQLRTSKWYPNDWDVYCTSTSVRYWFERFLREHFQQCVLEGRKQFQVNWVGGNEELVTWWRCGPRGELYGST